MVTSPNHPDSWALLGVLCSYQCATGDYADNRTTFSCPHSVAFHNILFARLSSDVGYIMETLFLWPFLQTDLYLDSRLCRNGNNRNFRSLMFDEMHTSYARYSFHSLLHVLLCNW